LEVARAATTADRAAVERAAVDVDHCTIRSPIDGVAGYLAVQQGNLVKGNADTALVTINEIAPAVVSFPIPDRYLSEVRQRLALGPLPLRVYAPGGGPELSAGSVSVLDNSVDNSTGTIRLKGVVPNRDHRLWPSQSLEAMLALKTERHVVIVPKEAVQQSERGPYLFVVAKNQTADLRSISTGAENDEKIVVTRGVEAGADVVVDGQLRLRPGIKVKIASAPKSLASESHP
ncbi:MAG: efflux RND transporter periplasmic adaptor subunit, partial [Acidobacteriaceae bacterium]|nr:efflux RND transporter periplasmic adaptor subunit [Acidobacteriaceae bacterium]